MDPLAENIVRRQYEMENIRRSYEPLIQDAMDYVNPRRYDFSSDHTKGLRRKTKMYDGVAQSAFLSWVDGILGWYISRGNVWCHATIPDARFRGNNRIIKYTQEYTEQMLFEINKGNFYKRLPEFLRDGAGSGTACMLTEESQDLTKAIHKVPHPAQVFIMEDDEGNVVTVHLKFRLTARQAVLKFGKSALDPKVAELAADASQGNVEFEFIHAIFPANDPAISPTRIGAKKWASVHVLLSARGAALGVAQTVITEARVVRKKGYDYNAATVWRFKQNSQEIYGYSPAMDVMCPIIRAQQIGRGLMHMGNIASDLPANIPEEQRATYSLLPAGRNFFTDPQRVISSIQRGMEYPIQKDREDANHDLIRERYGYQFWNAMRILASKTERVPATQVMELRADQAMMLVGQVDNLGDDGISPVWDNIAFIADRGGRLPDPPAELDDLRGKDAVKVKFVGPLAMFQDVMYKTNNLKQALQIFAGLAQAVGPQVFDAVKDVKLAEYLWESTGAPRDLLYDEDEVLAMRARAAQQQQIQQAAETAKVMAEGMSKLTKGAEPNSPMAQLSG